MGLAAILEYHAAEIFELSGQCGEGSQEREGWISPRAVFTALQGDGELCQTFPGIFRNSGMAQRTPSTLTETLPVHLINESMDACYEAFVGSLKESYQQEQDNLFVDPFSGVFRAIESDNTSNTLPHNNLVVLQSLVKAAMPSNPQDENIFHRKIAALESLSEDQQMELNALSRSLSVLYHIRCNEVNELHFMPIFDVEALHCLAVYGYSQLSKQEAQGAGIKAEKGVNKRQERSLPSLHLTMEACELLGCLLEHYLIALPQEDCRFAETFDGTASNRKQSNSSSNVGSAPKRQCIG